MYSELCCDCEIEEFELAFRIGPKRQRRATYFMLLTTPWKVFEQTGASGAQLSEEKDGAAPVGAKQRTRHYEKRQLAVEIACYWLGVSKPSIRFFDPIAFPALSHLPRKVAVGIRSVARIYDRLPIDNVRRVTNAFRKECKPLGEFKIVTNHTAGRYRDRRIDCVDIVLQHDRRESCLLCYSKEMATRNLSSGSGRSIGCGGTLLPESEEGLRNEIAYFRKNGDIKPRAKQLT